MRLQIFPVLIRKTISRLSGGSEGLGEGLGDIELLGLKEDEGDVEAESDGDSEDDGEYDGDCEEDSDGE